MSSTPLPIVGVFLSYADADASAAEDLWSRLSEALGPSRNYRWELWAFRDQLLVGEDFNEQIHAAIANAELGVFAISPAFLNSSYIREHELPPFLSPAGGKRVAPVQLKALARNADLRGLASRQVYGYHTPFWAGSRPHVRDAWALGLADELHKVATKYGLGR